MLGQQMPGAGSSFSSYSACMTWKTCCSGACWQRPRFSGHGGRAGGRAKEQAFGLGASPGMRRRGLAVPGWRCILLTDQSQRARAVRRRPCNGIASRDASEDSTIQGSNDVDERTLRLPVASCRLWWQLVEKKDEVVVQVVGWGW